MKPFKTPESMITRDSESVHGDSATLRLAVGESTCVMEQPEEMGCMTREDANRHEVPEKPSNVMSPSHKQGRGLPAAEMAQDTVRSQGFLISSLKAGEGLQVMEQKCRVVNSNLLKSTRLGQQDRLVQIQGCRDGCERNRAVKKMKGEWKRRRKKGTLRTTPIVPQASGMLWRCTREPRGYTVIGIEIESDAIVSGQTGRPIFEMEVTAELRLRSASPRSCGGSSPGKPYHSEVMDFKRIYREASVLPTKRELNKFPSNAVARTACSPWDKKKEFEGRVPQTRSSCCNHSRDHIIEQAGLGADMTA